MEIPPPFVPDDLVLTPQETREAFQSTSTTKLVFQGYELSCRLVLIKGQLAWIPEADIEMTEILAVHVERITFTRYVERHEDSSGGVSLEQTLLGRPILILANPTTPKTK